MTQIGTHKWRRENIVEQEDSDMDIPDGDIYYGKFLIQTTCLGCHSLDYDTELAPELRSVYLRKSGSRKGFKGYSGTMHNYDFYWTRDMLDKFLENPEKLFPDTNMYFDGLPDPYARASIIDYLHYLKIETVPKIKKNII